MKILNNYIGRNFCTDSEFGIGDIVKHSTFGVGKVLATVSIAGDQRVTVFFQNERKRLILEVKYTNLKKMWNDKWMILSDFNVGDIIEHNIFGVGKVMVVSGAGLNQCVGAIFKDGTKKKLIVKYANLTKLF
jgi:hypothetical protein